MLCFHKFWSHHAKFVQAFYDVDPVRSCLMRKETISGYIRPRILQRRSSRKLACSFCDGSFQRILVAVCAPQSLTSRGSDCDFAQSCFLSLILYKMYLTSILPNSFFFPLQLEHLRRKSQKKKKLIFSPMILQLQVNNQMKN